MRYRLNYISNSSSSSFVVYGRAVDSFKQACRLVDEGRTIYCVHFGAGWSGDSEDFVFKLTKERYELLLKSHDFMYETIHDIQIIDTDFVIVGDDKREADKPIHVPELKGGMVYAFDRDDKSAWTDSVDDEHFTQWLEWWGKVCR